MSMSDRQRYRFVGTWDEDGVHGYEWRWTVPPARNRASYDEVCVASAADFWAGRDTFGYYMDYPATQPRKDT